MVRRATHLLFSPDYNWLFWRHREYPNPFCYGKEREMAQMESIYFASEVLKVQNFSRAFNFKTKVEGTVGRNVGENYFHSGNILELNMNGNGTLHAEVDGNFLYAGLLHSDVGVDNCSFRFFTHSFGNTLYDSLFQRCNLTFLGVVAGCYQTDFTNGRRACK